MMALCHELCSVFATERVYYAPLLWHILSRWDRHCPWIEHLFLVVRRNLSSYSVGFNPSIGGHFDLRQI